MPNYTIHGLGESQITISNGETLSNATQGDGSHLVGETITLNSANFESISLYDSNTEFRDLMGTPGGVGSDQSLTSAQDFDGVSYAVGSSAEAEYLITLQDQAGNTYQAVGLNLRNPSDSSGHKEVEGLAFLDGPNGFPPLNEALTVTSSSDTPKFQSSEYYTPLCFAAGSRIRTPTGDVPVEVLRPGDMVLTLDSGAQPVHWIGRLDMSETSLRDRPNYRPVRIKTHAFGTDRPCQDLLVSPQHRVLIRDWRAQMFFGEDELLVPAVKLVNGGTITRALPNGGVSYFHVLLEEHHLLWSNGLLTESLWPGQSRDLSDLLRPPERRRRRAGVAPVVRRCAGGAAQRIFSAQSV